MPDDHFCPDCGHSTAPDDQFCRRCGAALGEQPDAAGHKRRRGPVVIAVLALVACAGAATAVLAAGGVLGGDEDPADRALVDPRAALRAQLAAPFQKQMDIRDEFFAAEREYRAAMRSARRTLREYRRADRDYKAELKQISDEFADEFDECTRFNIPCPDPDYPEPPKVPSFKEQIKDLKRSAKQLSALQATASSLQAPERLASLQAQLVTAVTMLRETAEHNADVLSEAIEEPEYEAAGQLDKGKLETLRNQDMPSVRALNAGALEIVRDLGLDLSRYDLPGGRDIDTKDSSQDV